MFEHKHESNDKIHTMMMTTRYFQNMYLNLKETNKKNEPKEKKTLTTEFLKLANAGKKKKNERNRMRLMENIRFTFG